MKNAKFILYIIYKIINFLIKTYLYFLLLFVLFFFLLNNTDIKYKWVNLATDLKF